MLSDPRILLRFKTHKRVQLLSTATCIDQRVYSIWICVSPDRTDSLIHTIFPLSEKDEYKKEASKTKKVDLFELSSSKKARLHQKAKENLRQKRMEAKILQSLAKIERLVINGQTIQF